MTESRIHELILKIRGQEANGDPNRQDRGLIKDISKTVAELIYSNLEDVNITKRLQLLVSTHMEHYPNHLAKQNL